VNDHHKRSEKRRRPIFIPERYSADERKRIDRKSRARRADPTRKRKPRRRDWANANEEEDFERMLTGRDRIALEPKPESPVEGEEHDDAAGEPALVLSVDRGKVRVLRAGEECDAELSPRITASPQAGPVVGDEVRVSSRGSDILRIETVRPRRTTLSRPDPANPNRERVIAANVDVATMVVSVRAPAFHPRLIDRFLIAIARGGVRPLLCVNKLDLLEHSAERREIDEALVPYEALGVSVVLASATSGEGIDELRGELAGRTCVFVGQSGVGKSTLLNTLDPSCVRRTREGREHDGKGRHTTSRSTLTTLADGTRVIDTPGIRSFGLWEVTRETLREEIPEFDAFAPRCRFRDCTHRHEPSCAVREAVADGAVPRSRYEAYLRLLDSLD